MTKLALSTRFGFAAVVLAALPSVAGAVRPKVPIPTPAERDAAMLRKYDLNRNGVIDPFERRRMMAERKDNVLDRFDDNDNGRLGPRELAEAREYRIERLIRLLDRNRDGFISYREARLYSETNLFEKFRAVDRNDDWLLSKRELIAAHYIQAHGYPRHTWWSWWSRPASG